MRLIYVLGMRDFAETGWTSPVISIVAEGIKHPESPASPRLNLHFGDSDKESLERERAHVEQYLTGDERDSTLGYYDRMLQECMTSKQADQIRDFVNGLDPQCSLMVHCEAGISRSAGVAAGLEEVGAGKWMNRGGQHQPNLWVKRLIRESFRALTGSSAG